jgi:murein DD-endopeptidase MepM/ murein hydrolase activator NlpD
MSDQMPGNQILGDENRDAGKSRWMALWEVISNAGLAEVALRLGTHALLIALILLVAWGLREFYVLAQTVEPSSRIAAIDSLPTPTPTESLPGLPALQFEMDASSGITRWARPHTDAPARPRVEVVVYTVKPGDTLFGIAEKFGLKPETLLWANQLVLGDNPHNLRPDQELNILPVDGTYHRWSAGDSLSGVAKFFGVTPQEIITFTGNNLPPELLEDWSDPEIEPGTWLVIPGGRREFVSWSAPDIPLDNPAVARVLGPGACEAVGGGAVGSGVFAWPADNHFLSGFDYDPEANHPAIDIDGEEGDPVYAADSGVVVYAGWNNWGYGNMIVLNHGNGWQTLYAHLSAFYVSCGESVWQGIIIGAIGSTGSATGSHLHFEMMFEGAKVNPWDYLP